MLKVPSSFLLSIFVMGLLATPSSIRCAKQIEPIYTAGGLGRNFESWSWGISYMDFEDMCPGDGNHHKTCLCAEVIPYGALSFKASKPFSPFGGAIHLNVYTNSETGLQMQLESSSESEYSISDIVDISGGNHKHTGAKKNHFFKEDVSLTPMARTAETFDRIVLGNCLENDATCLKANEETVTKICIESMYIEILDGASTHRASKFNGN